MASYRDLLKAAKTQINEIGGAAAEDRLGKAIFLDVREPDEFEQGAIPESIHIPRGHLESQVEGKVAERDAEVVIVCAAGNRSAFAAVTMQEMGYTNVTSLIGGFNKWKDEGRSWRKPLAL